MAQGDFAGAQRIFKAIRADFAIVAKLQNGGALNMFEASKFLSGRLNNLLTALGATPDQIKNGIDNGNFKLANAPHAKGWSNSVQDVINNIIDL